MACLHLQSTLGGLHNLHEIKNAKRLSLDLPPLMEDPHDVCKHMRASSPPNSCTDLIEQQQPRRSFRSTTKKVTMWSLSLSLSLRWLDIPFSPALHPDLGCEFSASWPPFPLFLSPSAWLDIWLLSLTSWNRVAWRIHSLKTLRTTI